MPNNAPDATASFAADDPDLVYVNGIDFNTGKYAVPPRRFDDLAKLNHNLIFNHDIVNKNLFSVSIDDNVTTSRNIIGA